MNVPQFINDVPKFICYSIEGCLGCFQVLTISVALFLLLTLSISCCPSFIYCPIQYNSLISLTLCKHPFTSLNLYFKKTHCECHLQTEHCTFTELFPSEMPSSSKITQYVFVCVCVWHSIYIYKAYLQLTYCFWKTKFSRNFLDKCIFFFVIVKAKQCSSPVFCCDAFGDVAD